MRVCEMLVADDVSRNSQALQENLFPMDAQAVKGIPLVHCQGDFWAWSTKHHGLYSVRSAYRLLAEQEYHERHHREGRASHSVASDDPYWQKLWKCKVPLKVRMFWWRVPHDFMPCRANLHHKHIETIATCTVCGMEDEMTYHTLT